MQPLPERASYNRLARFRRNHASRQVRGRKEIADREAWELRAQGKYQVGGIMEVINRKENPALDRVELQFQWDHSNEATPSLSQMVEAAAKAEPGADRDMVVVKNVNTRFGMSRTTGTALIYGSSESKSIEPEYVIQRHSTRANTATKENAPSDEEDSQPEESEGQPEESEEGDA